MCIMSNRTTKRVHNTKQSAVANEIKMEYKDAPFSTASVGLRASGVSIHKTLSTRGTNKIQVKTSGILTRQDRDQLESTLKQMNTSGGRFSLFGTGKSVVHI